MKQIFLVQMMVTTETEDPVMTARQISDVMGEITGLLSPEKAEEIRVWEVKQ